MSTPEVAKLFLVVLGGRIDGCQVELHDVRFVVGPTIETTIPAVSYTHLTLPTKRIV